MELDDNTEASATNGIPEVPGQQTPPSAPSPPSTQANAHHGTDFRIPGLSYGVDTQTSDAPQTVYNFAGVDMNSTLLSSGFFVPNRMLGQRASAPALDLDVTKANTEGSIHEETLDQSTETSDPTAKATDLKPEADAVLTSLKETSSIEVDPEQMASPPEVYKDDIDANGASEIDNDVTDRPQEGSLSQTAITAPLSTVEPDSLSAMKIETDDSSLEFALSTLEESVNSDTMAARTSLASEANVGATEQQEASPPQLEDIKQPTADVEMGNTSNYTGSPPRESNDTPTEHSVNLQDDQRDDQPPLTRGIDPHSSVTAMPPPASPLPRASDPEAEVAYDSSPYSSSTPSSSGSSSSDSDSDDTADDYELLGPAEQARLLMAEDGGGGSDGEGGDGSGKIPEAPKTLNEKAEIVVPKPDIVITPEMQINLLGHVETVVENVSLIKATTSGEYQVLEAGSLLCLEDRTVIGVVAETLGRVQQPFYSVAFTNAAGMAELGMQNPGAKVFYVPQFAHTVFTQAIKGIKGSDASNLHDEEVDDEEMEFSDDEKEAEHKRMVKQRWEARKRDRDGVPAARPTPNSESNRRSNGRKRQLEQGNRGNNQWRNNSSSDPNHMSANDGPSELQYEDDSGLYTPLVRPSNLHEMGHVPPPPPPTMQSYSAPGHSRPPRGGGGRGGRFSGPGRGRGGRGGGHALPPRPTMTNGPPPNNQNHPNGYPQPYNFPQAYPHTAATTPGNYPYSNLPYPATINDRSAPQTSPPPPTPYPNGFAYQHQSQQPPQQPAQQGYQMMYQPQQQQINQPQFPFQGHQPQQSLQQPNLPPGAYINPAFFRPPPG